MANSNNKCLLESRETRVARGAGARFRAVWTFWSWSQTFSKMLIFSGSGKDFISVQEKIFNLKTAVGSQAPSTRPGSETRGGDSAVYWT